MTRYARFALIYALLALVGGVFYREFTKWMGFTGQTQLSVVHAHYFMLGMVFFLLLVLLEKSLHFTTATTPRLLLGYHVGLNLSVVMMLVRGITQAQAAPLTRGMDAALSGIAGLGHILLGVTLIALLWQIMRAAGRADR